MPTRRTEPDRLTSLLGEKLRSALPGYGVTLAVHRAGTTVPPSRRVCVVEILERRLEAVVWVDPLPHEAAGVDHDFEMDVSVQIRMVLRSSELDGEIAEVSGDQVDATPDEIVGDVDFTETVLRRTDDTIGELISLVEDAVDPRLTEDLARALRVYKNDPFVR